MPNSLTIHFHLKHFKESGLPFSEYALLLLYEQKEDWSVNELQEIFKISDRTMIRMRGRLYKMGFLKRTETLGEYCLTQKWLNNDTSRI
jgi:DNA-binding MarR family transcriptional regulator